MTETATIIFLLALWWVYKQERKANIKAALGLAEQSVSNLLRLAAVEVELAVMKEEHEVSKKKSVKKTVPKKKQATKKTTKNKE